MVLKVLGGIDIVAGILLLLARSYFQSFSLIALLLGFILTGKGLYSWV